MDVFLLKQQDAALLKKHSILDEKSIMVWFKEQLIWRTPLETCFQNSSIEDHRWQSCYGVIELIVINELLETLRAQCRIFVADL